MTGCTCETHDEGWAVLISDPAVYGDQFLGFPDAGREQVVAIRSGTVAVWPCRADAVTAAQGVRHARVIHRSGI